MSAFYNEIDAYPATWLENLSAAGEIARGHVDTRSIADVDADDLAFFDQAHFFAGIGGWSHALRLAGWPDDRPVWTGSCPCQPFSAAGQRAGADDPRHLWPQLARLIHLCRPPVVFGEQVASADGRRWAAAVSADLEGMGYGVVVQDRCAAGVGAPHIRQRLWWCAVRVDDAAGARHSSAWGGEQTEPEGRRGVPWLGRQAGGLADADRRERDRIASGEGCQRDGSARGRQQGDGGPTSRGDAGGLADRILSGLEGHAGHGDDRDEPGRIDADPAGPVAEGGGTGGMADADSFSATGCGVEARRGLVAPVKGSEAHRGIGDPRRHSGPLHGFWRDADWLRCRDGKWRPVEPGTFPLADGLPGRVGRLRAYGNAIVPQVAAAFIRAVMPVIDDLHPWRRP